ncbi:MAG: hypothetical protein KA586_06680 [Candidatus Promineofilum sp.]|nr:hypothetical protein [Promineifilum sp.]
MDKYPTVLVAAEGQEGQPPGRLSLSLPVVALVSALLSLLFFVALAGLGQCGWEGLCGPILAEETAQGRVDTALPAPQPGLVLEQTLTPRRNGLSEIELLLVRYGGEAAGGGDRGRFTVELWTRGNMLIANETLATQDLSHNQVYTLHFPPQADSAGHVYTLRLSGNEYNHVSVWGYSLDVYDGGQVHLMTPGPPPAADLRFVTRYTLTPGDAAMAAAAPLREGRLFLTALLVLFLPGALWLSFFRPRGWDGAAWWGAALALGVATWPVLWQWVSLAGGRWSGPSLWGVVAVGWAVVVAQRRSGQPLAASPDAARPAVAGRSSVVIMTLLLAILLITTIASRFIAIRDLAFPPWVDSSRHALITAVMVESGQVINDYAPFLAVDHFPYHYGFHTLAAGLALMTRNPLPGLLLFLMQLLAGLLPLSVYAAGWMVTRRRAVGLLAAFLVALPFFFPGYYATWGRMTQLAAMVIMPVLLALTWRLGRGWARFWPLVGVLAAGVFLIHFRVFLFYLPFAALVAVVHLAGRRRSWAVIKAGGLGALLVAPRLVTLLKVTEPLATFQRSLPGYNDFPLGYVTTGWERFYLAAVGAAAVVVLAAVVRRRRWAAFPVLLLLWVGALFALLAGERLGLPESLVVNLNSMYITLFLPQALFLAIVAGRVWAFAGRRVGRSPVGLLLAAAAGLVLGLLAVSGWRQQVNILNPQTILALPQDTAALSWANDNLPADARVAVNAWRWLGATWAGSDGGAWLVPLTGREATTPPVDHIYNVALFAEVRAFNEAATAVADWGDPAAAEWLAGQGVTHVFVGRRGGFFDPAALARNPGLEMIYQRDGTFIFAVK